jgi:hypothetical protein
MHIEKLKYCQCRCAYLIGLILPTLVATIDNGLEGTEPAHCFLDQFPSTLNCNLAAFTSLRFVLFEIHMYALVETTFGLIAACIYSTELGLTTCWLCPKEFVELTNCSICGHIQPCRAYHCIFFCCKVQTPPRYLLVLHFIGCCRRTGNFLNIWLTPYFFRDYLGRGENRLMWANKIVLHAMTTN